MGDTRSDDLSVRLVQDFVAACRSAAAEGRRVDLYEALATAVGDRSNGDRRT